MLLNYQEETQNSQENKSNEKLQAISDFRRKKSKFLKRKHANLGDTDFW